MAAGFSFDNILELRNNSSLTHQIDDISGDIRTRVFATVVIPIVSSLIIPLGVIMIIISLFKINLGVCRKLFIATVRLFELLAQFLLVLLYYTHSLEFIKHINDIVHVHVLCILFACFRITVIILYNVM